MEKQIQFKVNGKSVSLTLEKNRMLLWVLRSDLRLTGTKYCCGESLCGACTVLVNDEAVRSCRFPIKDAEGKEIKTIESLGQNGNLHPLQTAFMKYNALQCGFCTPGMIITAYSLLVKNPQPTRRQVIKAMEGNLCRCGSYDRIIRAIQDAGLAMTGGTP